MASPKIARFLSEFSEQFQDVTNKEVKIHHELTPSRIKREHTALDKIKSAILSHCNPFTVEGNRLSNLVTHAYVPDECVRQILTNDDVGKGCMKTMLQKELTATPACDLQSRKKTTKCIYQIANVKQSKFGIKLLI